MSCKFSCNVDKICALLRNYEAYSGNFKPTFREKKLTGLIFKGQNVQEESQKSVDFTSVPLFQHTTSLKFSAYFINGFCFDFQNKQLYG